MAASVSACFQPQPFPPAANKYSQTGALKQKNGSLSVSACLQPQPFPPTANKYSQTGALKQKNGSVSECLPSAATFSLNGEQMQPNWCLETEEWQLITECLLSTASVVRIQFYGIWNESGRPKSLLTLSRSSHTCDLNN